MKKGILYILYATDEEPPIGASDVDGGAYWK